MIEATITDEQLAKATELLDELINASFDTEASEGARRTSQAELKAAERMLEALGFTYGAGRNLEIVIRRADKEEQ